MNVFNIKRAFEQKKERGWPVLYFAIDLHDTIIKGTYSKFNEGREFYPYAKEVLQWLTKRPDMKLILWTSSHPEPIADILSWLESHDIKFDFVNENPDCKNTKLCDFSKKLYMSVILDDKAGYDGETGWIFLAAELKIATGEEVINWTPRAKDDLTDAIHAHIRIFNRFKS